MEVEIKGYSILIDEDDLHFINAGNKWHAAKSGKSIYFRRWSKCINGKRHREWLHREIMGNNPYYLVDHINCNTLDNRKINLRYCTVQQSNQNKTSHNKSGYKGVRYDPDDKLYHAAGKHNGVTFYLGARKNGYDAYLLYCKWAMETFGEFANLNSN